MFGKKDPLTATEPRSLAKQIAEMVHEKTMQQSPEDRIKTLMELDNMLYKQQGKASIAYGDGIHSKHKHINYHKFFEDNVKSGENVLDIGSSMGELTSDIAKAAAPGKVVGIEIEPDRVVHANATYSADNLEFVEGDATEFMPEHKVDVITMSNVLEHIEDRTGLLKKLKEHYNPDRFIIRVPVYERDWRVPLKDELGIEYRLDSTHFIEFTQDTFKAEMADAGLKVIEMNEKWGEIWAVVA